MRKWLSSIPQTEYGAVLILDGGTHNSDFRKSPQGISYLPRENRSPPYASPPLLLPGSEQSDGNLRQSSRTQRVPPHLGARVQMGHRYATVPRSQVYSLRLTKQTSLRSVK